MPSTLTSVILADINWPKRFVEISSILDVSFANAGSLSFVLKINHRKLNFCDEIVFSDLPGSKTDWIFISNLEDIKFT